MSRPVLLTGATGQLGKALLPGLRQRFGSQLMAPTRQELDLVRFDALDAWLRQWRPQLILHTAAWTDVDGAERHAETVMTINRDVPQALAAWAAAYDASLIHLSTDYVFDGQTTRPYVETDPLRALSVYGQSKLEAEQRIQAEKARAYIIRTGWLLGLHAGFLPAIFKSAQQNKALRVVADSRGTPTPVNALAAGLQHGLEHILTAPHVVQPGVYHLAGQGEASWWDVAVFLLEHWRAQGRSLHLGPEAVEAIRQADYLTTARRPLYSSLDSSLFCQTFDWQTPPWQESLQALLQNGADIGVQV